MLDVKKTTFPFKEFCIHKIDLAPASSEIK